MDQKYSPLYPTNFSLLVFLIIIFLPWAIYKFNLEPFQQSRLGVIVVATSKTDLKSGLYWYQKALAKPVFTNPEARLLLVKTIFERQEKVGPEIFKQGINFAISEMEKGVKEHPLDVRYWLYLGEIYTLAGLYNQDFLVKAEESLNHALQLSPQRQQIYFDLARIKFIQKKFDEAKELAQRAFDFDPRAKEAKEFLNKLEELIKENL